MVVRVGGWSLAAGGWSWVVGDGRSRMGVVVHGGGSFVVADRRSWSSGCVGSSSVWGVVVRKGP